MLEGLFGRLGYAKATKPDPYAGFAEDRQRKGKAVQQGWWWNPKRGAPRKFDLVGVQQLSKTPFVSMCFQAILDRVAAVEWEIVSKDPDSATNETDSHLDAVRSFFDNPNQNDESWHDIQRQVVMDILNYDAGSIEKVFDRYEDRTIEVRDEKGKVTDTFTAKVAPEGAKLTEIYATDGSTFLKDQDAHGYLNGYWQYNYSATHAEPTYFNSNPQIGKGELIYIPLNRKAGQPYGTSRLESLLEIELGEVLVQAVRLNLSFYKNSAMPGLHVHFPDVTDKVALKHARDAIDQEYGSTDKAHRTIVTGGQTVISSPAMSNQQLQALELQNFYLRLVMATLGVTPAMMGFTETVNKATAMTQRQEFRDRTLNPILSAMEYYVNTQLIPEFGFDDVEFRFVTEPDIDSELLRAQIMEIWLRTGYKKINEVRSEHGLAPVPWGDAPFAMQSLLGPTPPTKIAKSATKIADRLAREEKDLLGDVRENYGKVPLDKLRKETLEKAKTIIRKALTESARDGSDRELPEAMKLKLEAIIIAAYRDFERILESLILELMTNGSRAAS